MATLDAPDPNILDAEEINWRLIVYPIVGVFILLLGGVGLYFYLQNQRQEHEDAARAALLQAKTTTALVQVADQFPGTTHAILALLSAADLSFAQKDYDSAEKDYRRVTGLSGIDPALKDSAQLGLASCLEAAGGPPSDAITAYLDVAQRGKSSPYAPFAYLAAARLYEQEHDKESERRLLTEAVSLGGESAFVKEAQQELSKLDMPALAPSVPPSSSATP